MLSLLLQSDHIEPLEELTLLVALSLVDDDLAGCKEVYSTLGRSFVDVEHLVIPVSPSSPSNNHHLKALTCDTLALAGGKMEPCLPCIHGWTSSGSTTGQ